MAEKNLIKIYVNATSAKRVDIIIRHESTLCLKMIGSTGMKYMIEYRKSIDVIVSCVEYGCIPYIRYPVAFHYISLLSENMLNIKHIATLRFKMSVAFVVYKLCDKNRLSTVYIEEFLNKIQEHDFNSKLFCVLNEHGINEKKFFDSTITNIVIDELEKFYSILSREEDSDKVENQPSD